MKSGRIKAALLSAVGVALATLAMLTLSPTTALALDGGAGGGGSGGGGSGSWGDITKWSYVSSWGEFENARYMVSNHGSAANYVRTSSGGQGLVDLCSGPNLLRIYYLSADSGAVIKPNSGSGTFPWTNPAGGDTVDQYASGLNGKGVYVICVINPIERRTTTEWENQARNDGAGVTYTADYSWSTAVSPQLNTAAGVDPIGVNNLNTQAASNVNSNFAGIYDSIVGGGGDYNSKVTQIQNAIGQDASKTHAAVVLNAGNKAGLAEGGILNVSEQTRKATITLTQNWTENRSRQVTCDYRPGSNDPLPGSCSYQGWTGWSENAGSRNHNVNKNLGTQSNTGFFQLLSVHCNPNEFNALTARLTALGGANAYKLISQTTGVDGSTTSVIQTQRFASLTASQSSQRMLGVSTSTTPEVKRTSELGFYDKECNVQCLSNPNTASGASTLNGATSNADITSNNQANPGTYGGATLVKDGTTNSNYFELFRNNDTSNITVNTAYPRNNDPQLKYGGVFLNAAGTGNVTIPASAPVSTTVTRWAEGTPGTNKGAQGGVFQMTAVTKDASGKVTASKPLFQSQTGTVGVQKNFGVDPYSSPNSEVLSGFFRSFDVQSTWASEKDKPQVINVKWEYRPTVYTRFPSNVGFTTNNTNTQVVSNTEVVVDQAIDVKCYAQYGSYDRNVDLSAKVQSSTGSGTTNTLDSGPLEAPSGDNSWLTPSNLVIKFVRGVAE